MRQQTEHRLGLVERRANPIQPHSCFAAGQYVLRNNLLMQLLATCQMVSAEVTNMHQADSAPAHTSAPDNPMHGRRHIVLHDARICLAPLKTLLRCVRLVAHSQRLELHLEFLRRTIKAQHNALASRLSLNH